MGFPFQGGCLFPLKDFFNSPDKGGVRGYCPAKTFSKNHRISSLLPGIPKAANIEGVTALALKEQGESP